MKTIQFSALLFSLVLLSCTNDNEMLTVIHADGSCYREFYAPGDSAFVLGDTVKNPFPIDFQAIDKIVFIYNDCLKDWNYPLNHSCLDTINSAKLKLLARCDFRSIADLSQRFHFKKGHPWDDLEIRYDLKTAFRWFYTYYHYTETYPKIEPNAKIPWENYMTEDEYRFWLTGNPNPTQGMNGLEMSEFLKELENKYEQLIDSCSQQLETDSLFMKHFGTTYDYRLLMPGQTDTLTWRLSAERMLCGEYCIEAHSRKTNIWAFVVSGIVLVLALGAWFYKGKK
ncbi:MAG: hypothetical protein LBG77_08455 [Dysgonamonadaceae bacterium]|jgi:hypothetical protein|nr:hypothetical protein [Dysgonamonadaceae bacterium]